MKVERPTPFLLRWWRFAQAAAGSLSAPRTDVPRSDRAFEAELRGSAGFHALQRVVRSFDRAATTSRFMNAVHAIRSSWRSASRESRVSAFGLMAAAGSVTALILPALSPSGVAPFSWAVPSLALATGVAVMAAAGPIARALDRAGF